MMRRKDYFLLVFNQFTYITLTKTYDLYLKIKVNPCYDRNYSKEANICLIHKIIKI